MDVSLVIENIDSLELALQQFVSPETMDTENKIYCDVCKCNTKSSKFFRSSFVAEFVFLLLQVQTATVDLNGAVKTVSV